MDGREVSAVVLRDLLVDLIKNGVGDEKDLFIQYMVERVDLLDVDEITRIYLSILLFLCYMEFRRQPHL